MFHVSDKWVCRIMTGGIIAMAVHTIVFSVFYLTF
jgi:hypothetical protein